MKIAMGLWAIVTHFAAFATSTVGAERETVNFDFAWRFQLDEAKPPGPPSPPVPPPGPIPPHRKAACQTCKQGQFLGRT
jgi:hypothetical protein